MPASQPIDFNLFTFAKRELSHSAFWAWVLQSLCPGCPPNLEAIRPLAKNLLQRLGAANFDVTEVRTEYCATGSPKSGRMDVVAFGRERKVVLIEHKVGALPVHQQLERYRRALEGQLFHVEAAAIVSCGIVQPLSDTDARWIGPRSLRTIIAAYRDCHPFVSMYADWLDERVRSWDEATNLIISGQQAVRPSPLAGPEGQWGYMELVAKQLIRERVVAASALQQSNGTSRGRPWTQLRFFNGSGDFDALFYRVDVPLDIEFTLKQYQKPAKPGKDRRLDALREMFSEAVRKCGASFSGLKPRKRSKKVQNEARIATVSLTKVAPSTLIKELPAVHAAFVQQLREHHWPIGDAN